MKLKHLFAGAAALAIATTAVAADASTITYTFTGDFTGTLDGGAFSVPAVFTATADTANVYYNGFSNVAPVDALKAVSGGVTYNISTPNIAYTNFFGYAGLDFGSGSYFSGNSGALVGYDMVSNFATTSINYFEGINASFQTDRGFVNITGATNGTFAASLAGVPEPATWGLMILGFGAVGGAMRRRSSVKVSYAAA